MDIPKILLQLLLVGVFAILFACSPKKDDSTLLVGTSADNPPYEYMKKGKLHGFDIDVMHAIAKKLDKNVQFKNMDFHGLLAALSSRNVDMVIAAMSVTEERINKVDFSISYSEAKLAILLKKDQQITELPQLANKIIGSQLGTTWSVIANELGRKHNFKTKTLANNLMLVEEMKLGRIDAVIMEESQVQKFMIKNENFTMLSLPEYSSAFSIALPKNSILKSDIDRAIKELQSSGEIKALEQKWGIFDGN